MSFGNVRTGTIRVATPAEREKFLREGREAIESKKKIQELRQKQAGIIKQIAQNIGEEADRGKEASLKKIATYQQEIAAANAERDHALLHKALCQAIFNKFKPSKEELTKAKTTEAQQALQQKSVNATMKKAAEILAKHEAKGIFGTFSEQSQCMILTQDAANLILDALSELEWRAADLTKFEGEIELKALNAFLASGIVSEVTLAKEAEDIGKKAQFGKNVKVYVQKDNGLVELQPQSVSIPQSLPIASNKKEASPNSSPEGSPKRVHSSPEGSPPKYSVAAPISRPLPELKVNSPIQPQVAKPLPAVPPKPLPKPPARKEAALEAK